MRLSVSPLLSRTCQISHVRATDCQRQHSAQSGRLLQNTTASSLSYHLASSHSCSLSHSLPAFMCTSSSCLGVPGLSSFLVMDSAAEDVVEDVDFAARRARELFCPCIPSSSGTPSFLSQAPPTIAGPFSATSRWLRRRAPCCRACGLIRQFFSLLALGRHCRQKETCSHLRIEN